MVFIDFSVVLSLGRQSCVADCDGSLAGGEMARGQNHS